MEPAVHSLSREDKLALLRRLAEGPREYPASFSQRRLWFLERLEPGAAHNTIFRAFRLEGPLDDGALAGAVGELVRRHEALRTCFAERDGEPVQVVAPADGPAAGAFARVSLRGLPAGARDRALRDLARRAAGTPFDLSRAPLVRVLLAELEGRSHALLVAVHHAVADGWSLGVLFRDLSALYAARRTRRGAAGLPTLRVRYGEIARRQREALRGEGLERELRFWRAYLDGAPRVLELPTDRPRPALESFRGSIQPFRIDAAATAASAGLAREERASPFMVLFAAWACVLARWSGRRDLLVGTPVAGRPDPETEDLVGSFANTLVLRADLRGAPSGRDLVRRIRSGALEAFAHQEMPFEHLVDALSVERDLSRNPLYQVMFALQNQPPGEFRLAGTDARPLPVRRGLSKVDLTVDLVERDGALAGYLEYNTDLFDRTTAARLARHLAGAVRALARDPDRPAAELPPLPAPERQALLVEWNDTRSPLPRGAEVQRLAAESATVHPERIAVEADGRAWSYGHLWRRVEELAGRLEPLGAGAGSRVALGARRSPEAVTALLAVLETGSAYVPLDPDYPDERLAFLMEDSGSRVVLADRDLVDRMARLAPAGAVVLRLSGRSGADGPRGSAPQPRAPRDGAGVAYVVYTSGTTGRPKGVAVPHRAVLNHAAAVVRAYGLVPGERVLQFASLSFDIAGEEIFPTLAEGGTLVLRTAETPLEPDAFARFVGERRLGLVNVPTPLWHEWSAELESGRAVPPDCLRAVVVGTEGALAERLAAWRKALADPGRPRWINAYGPTEATVTATVFGPGRGPVARHRVPIGRPLANVGAFVADGDLRPVPPGVPGELLLGGAGLARGYLGRPAATARVFVPSPFAGPEGPGGRLYRTGDLARVRSDGALEFLGRTDDQLKIRGFRVEPGEIESVLAAHPGLREAFVTAREVAPGDRRLVAYAVGEEPGGPGEEDLRRHVADRLPAYMVPEAFVLLAELPLTPAGKVDRDRLPAPDPAAAAGGGGAPRGPVEELLAGVFAEVLGRPRVGTEDDFFRLGGHSLLATRVVSRVRDRLGVELPLRALFEAPTVAALASRVAAARGGEALPPVAPTPRPGAGPWELPLSFAQQRLWVLDRLEPGKPIYNVPGAVRLEVPAGEPDAGLLRRALAAIVSRHEALRATFVRGVGEPVQRVQRRVPVRLGVVDLTGLEERAARAAGRGLAGAESRTPFDLERGPLFRFLLFRLPGGRRAAEHRLVVTFHHIVADGWSIDVFLRELAEHYDAFAADRPSPLAAPAVQYPDYAGWQRRLLEGDGLDRLLRFWRGALDGAPRVLDLPADRPRPPVPSYRGGRAYLRLEGPARERMEALARDRGASPFMAFYAAFAVLLARLSGSRDLLVGTPVAGRNRSELEPLIGLFVNSLVLRGDLRDDPPFGGLLDRTRESALDAFVHAELPFERLVEELQPGRDLAYNPVFQVMFSYQTSGLTPAVEGGGEGEAHDGLRPELLANYNDTARVDLALTLWPDRGGLAGFVEYADDLFDRTTAVRLAAWYRRAVEELARRPELRAEEVALLASAERHQVRLEWSDTRDPLPGGLTLDALFAESADRDPGAPAVSGPDGTLTYRELAARSGELAARLRGAGLGPEFLVGICAERTTRLVVALLGILRAGGAYVPLDPELPEERLAYMVDAARLWGVVADATVVDALPEAARCRVVTFLDGGAPGDGAPVPASVPEPAGGPDRLAYVLFTSGSTGRPKGVQVCHRSAVNFLRSMARRPGLQAGESLLAVTTLSFDIALLELFLPLSVGAEVVVAPAAATRHGADLAELVARTRPDAMQATPATWRLLLDTAGRRTASAERSWSGPPPARVLCGGEALPPELAARLVASGVELWNLYGPTETTVWSGALRIERAARGAATSTAVPVGGPVANTGLHVLDPGGRPQGAGVPGQLAVGGLGVARGYLGRPGHTADRFRPDPFGGVPGGRLYYTGDLVRWRGDGRLDFLGRLDHQVKVRGFRIELGEVEAVLSAHPWVRQATVAARDAPDGDRLLAAYVVATAEARPGAVAGELRAALRRSLPDYMVPAVFVELEALPLTPNGKVDRRRLPAPDGRSTGPDAAFVAPRGEAETAVASAWAEVLGTDRIGGRDDFFALGGHSLKATQLATRIEETFGLELPLRVVFERPTVAAQAEWIVERQLEATDEDELARALEEIEQLSEDELDALAIGGSVDVEGDG